MRAYLGTYCLRVGFCYSFCLLSNNIGLLQVKFVYEIFKKLRPGIPLKCMHGRMKYEVQQAIVAEFNESTSVLFSTDIFARGLDIRDVDWVVQVYLCPKN